MVMTDPIADFLTRIRNANQANHEVLEVPASNIKKGIAEILQAAGCTHGLREASSGRSLGHGLCPSRS